jgi:hypothetical protein
MNQDARRVLLAVFAGGAAVFGVLTINGTWLTPGAHGDSVAYLSAAESFSEHGTFEVPMTAWSDADSVTSLSHFPPGFPLLMSVPISLGTQSHAAALWVMALSAGVAVAFLALLASEAFGVGAGALFAALLLITPVFVRLHLVIWSEPTYLAITSLLLYAMVKRPGWAWAHGLLACAGLMVRYVGVAGTLAAMGWSVIQAKSARERVTRMVTAGAPSAIFLLWWSATVGQGGEPIREAGFYGGLRTSLSQATGMVTEWLVPGGWGGGIWPAVVLVVAGALVIGTAARGGSWRAPERRPLLQAALLYGGCYVAVVFASRLFADPRIPFDSRLFLPVLALVTLVFAASSTEVARAAGTRGWIVLGLCIGIWGFAALREDRIGIAAVNENGIYFTFGAWMSDPVIRWVDNRSAPFETIYSNEPALLYYQSLRHAKELPNEGEDFEAFRSVFYDRPGAVVIAYPLHVGNIPEEVFAEALGLSAVVRTSMGAVYVP